MTTLLACAILERSKTNECVWTWAYPSMTDFQKEYILKKTPVEDLKTFFYGKTKNTWFYISDVIEGDPECFDGEISFSIVLFSKDYSPDKYKKLCSTFCEIYRRTCDPTQVLRRFISIITIGLCHIDENGSPVEFGMREKHSQTNVKGLIKHFGLEAILIYSAMLLKKRLIIYHHNLLELLNVLKSFPPLLSHRKFDDVLFPWLEMSDEGLAALRNRRFFISGCYDNSVFSHLEVADVYVNIPAKEITISPSAKDDLAMTKIQKDVALYLIQLAESDETEAEVIKKIGEKTQEIINHLRTLSRCREDNRVVLYKSTLKDKDSSAAMENFLIQLAAAENILVLDSEE